MQHLCNGSRAIDLVSRTNVPIAVPQHAYAKGEFGENACSTQPGNAGCLLLKPRGQRDIRSRLAHRGREMAEGRRGEGTGRPLRTLGRALFLLAAALPVSTVLGTYTEPAPDTAGFEWRWSRAVPIAKMPNDGSFATDASARGDRDAHASDENERGLMTDDTADERRSPDGRGDRGSDAPGPASAEENAVPFLEELFHGEGDARGPVRIRPDDETLRSRRSLDGGGRTQR